MMLFIYSDTLCFIDITYSTDICFGDQPSSVAGVKDLETGVK